MQFMVIEHFVSGARPIYERFERDGRLMPEGLEFVASYVTADLTRCFQVMECEDITLLAGVGSPTGRTSPTSRSSPSSPAAG